MLKPRTTNPGPLRFVIPIVATAGIGTALYYRTRTSSNKIPRGEDLHAQRESDGLGGAGLGGANFPSGGAHKDVPRTDAPRHELPSSGAIGAGEGGGSTNVRAVDMFQGNPSDSNPHSASQSQQPKAQGSDHSNKEPSSSAYASNSDKLNTDSKISQGFQSLFGQGGKTSGESGDSNRQRKYSDTRSVSGDHEVPSKRAPNKTEL